MGFKKFDADDLTLDVSSITSAAWSDNTPTLTTFFSSSAQRDSLSGNSYVSVYQTGSDEANAAVQFNIAYGDVDGSGSLLYNPSVDGNSYSRTTYGSYRSLILNDSTSQFTFGSYLSPNFYAINVERARYKQELFPGTWTLTLSGGGDLYLTDDSQVETSPTYINGLRTYQIVSGSAGTVNTNEDPNGHTPNSGSYGLFLPEIGTMLLNPAALALNGSGGAAIGTNRNSNTADDNENGIFNTLSSFTLNSKENVSSDFVFVRGKNSEFNYSANASYISGSTGEVLQELWVDNPQTYVTSIGLYNDNQELLAIAKLSRPLVKDFTKELLVRVKLDF